MAISTRDPISEAILSRYFQKIVNVIVTKLVKSYFKPAIDMAVKDLADKISDNTISYMSGREFGITVRMDRLIMAKNQKEMMKELNKQLKARL